MKVKDFDLKCLIGSSALFFISIFTNKYIFVIVTLIWIANIIWCISKNLKNQNITLQEILTIHNNKTEQLKAENKASSIVYSLVIPMCIIGCITIFILLISILLS